MKPSFKLFAALTVAALAFPALAEEKDDDHAACNHGDEKRIGPNGGLVLHELQPHAEFLVTEDRKVKITFVDDDFQPVAIAEQTIQLMGGDRSNPTRLAFERVDDSLVSDGVLPDGESFPVILVFKASPDAKKVIEKFNLNLADCASCDSKEYACTCDHGHEHGEGCGH